MRSKFSMVYKCQAEKSCVQILFLGILYCIILHISCIPYIILFYINFYFSSGLSLSLSLSLSLLTTPLSRSSSCLSSASGKSQNHFLWFFFPNGNLNFVELCLLSLFRRVSNIHLWDFFIPLSVAVDGFVVWIISILFELDFSSEFDRNFDSLMRAVAWLITIWKIYV